MSILEMSEEEKNAIRKQHEDATKIDKQKKSDEKAGLQFKKPAEEKTKEEKSTL